MQITRSNILAGSFEAEITDRRIEGTSFLASERGDHHTITIALCFRSRCCHHTPIVMRTPFDLSEL